MRRESYLKKAACAIVIGGLLVTGLSADAQQIVPSDLLNIFDSSWTQFQTNGSADLINGKIVNDGRNYYAGDLALSFDGSAASGSFSSYEYAIDFGLCSKDYDGDKVDQIPGGAWTHSGFILDPHWNMSCGNDIIDKSLTVTPAPEPAMMLLFGAGLIGLSKVIRNRNKK